MPGKLSKYGTIKGTITCETGLRIGGSKESIEVGGEENTIIRHPITDLPYVPGSSLKGKLRSLLEQKEGKVSSGGEPCGCAAKDCRICRIFGPHMYDYKRRGDHGLGPTRIIVRDANLTPLSRDTLLAAQRERGLMFAEVKTEAKIDRRTGIAADKGLRTQERVPAGTQFDFEIAVRVFEGDKEPEILAFIEEGLKLLQQDYLGGSGSRGYGKVKLDYKVA